MLNLDRLNNELKSVLNKTGVDKLGSIASETTSQFDSLNKSKAASVGSTVSGIKVVAQDPLNSAAATKEPVVGKLTQNVPGVNVTETSSETSNISTLTGKTASNGFLKSVTTSTSPKAIRETLKRTTSAKENQIESVLQSASTNPSAVSLANRLDQSPFGLSNKFIEQTKIQKLSLNNLLGNPAALLSTPPALDNLPFNQLANFVSKVSGFNPITSIGNSLKSVFDTEAQTYLGGGLNIVDKFDTSNNPKKIIDEFGNTDISSQINTSPLLQDNVTINRVPEQIGDASKWTGSTTSDDTFTFVETAEELSLEIRNSVRDFSHVVVDFTMEFLDDDFSSKDFQQVYSNNEAISKGYNGLPFHYLIRKNGSIQRGIPIDVETTYPGGEYNYEKSVVVFISGGYKVPRDTENAEPELFLTSKSSEGLFFFLDVMYRMFPGIPIFADNDALDVGFDIEGFILGSFGKQNPNVTRPATGSTLTRTNVVEARYG